MILPLKHNHASVIKQTAILARDLGCSRIATDPQLLRAVLNSAQHSEKPDVFACWTSYIEGVFPQDEGRDESVWHTDSCIFEIKDSLSDGKNDLMKPIRKLGVRAMGSFRVRVSHESAFDAQKLIDYVYNFHNCDDGWGYVVLTEQGTWKWLKQPMRFKPEFRDIYAEYCLLLKLWPQGTTDKSKSVVKREIKKIDDIDVEIIRQYVRDYPDVTQGHITRGCGIRKRKPKEFEEKMNRIGIYRNPRSGWFVKEDNLDQANVRDGIALSANNQSLLQTNPQGDDNR
ncbi:hypothetical protein KS4_23530 [Poriferisphaera corsica]|uniref:Uncharacterized protein n=1 Tax=Poriferisphaera corsica TaxID=2528020 RepID=A0A517YVQ1_9BACT|nr:hypothetical protein [Poriferisphaera corsica]QDU34286.1 hypothetical protein KS4_23530 [Poriferisphaera corsica]